MARQSLSLFGAVRGFPAVRFTNVLWILTLADPHFPRERGAVRSIQRSIQRALRALHES